MVHFLLDTRSNYQKVKDWICRFFYKPPIKVIEIQRFVSSPERKNRATLFDEAPIMTPGFVRSSGTQTVKTYLNEIPRSEFYCPVCYEPWSSHAIEKID